MGSVVVSRAAPSQLRAFLALLKSSADRIKSRNHLGRKAERCGCEILAKVSDRRCSGDQQNVGRALKQPRECDLHRRGVNCSRCCIERRRLQRSETSQRKERHIRYALTREVIDKAVVIAMRDVVQVLHANNSEIA